MVNTQLYRENYSSDTELEYYRRSLTIPFLDGVISEFKERFSASHRIHASAFSRIPSKVVSENDWKEDVLSFVKEYETDMTNVLNVTSEIDLWHNFWLKEFKEKREVPDIVTDTLKSIIRKDGFPMCIPC